MARPPANTEAWQAVRQLDAASVARRRGTAWVVPADSLSAAAFAALFDAASNLGYRAVPAIFRYALHSVAGPDAIAHVLRLLGDVHPMGWLWLDHRIRKVPGWAQFTRSRPGAAAEKTAVLDDARMASILGHPVPLAGWWFLAMSPDGHQRERAIAHLADSSDIASLCQVIIRTLDWVQPVRRAARAAYALLVDRSAPDELLPVAPLVAHLAHAYWWQAESYGVFHLARLDLRVVEGFDRRFQGPQGKATLMRALRAPFPLQARAAYRLLSTTSVDDDVVAAALRSTDVVVQHAALSSDAAQRTPDQLDLALRSRFATVRRTALSTMADRFPDAAGPYLMAALFDRTETVRALARYLLAARGEDVSGLYRAALVADASTSTISASLLGIAELEKDWVLIEDYLHDARPQVRRAATVALGRADRDAAGEILPGLLADDDVAVSSAASRALVALALPAPQTLLVRNLRDSRFHVVRNSARLLPLCDVWQWLAAALDLACSADADRRAIGVSQLERWPDRRYLPREAPDPSLVPLLEEMSMNTPVLPAVVVAALQAHQLRVPTLTTLLLGTRVDPATVADRLAAAASLVFVRRWSGYRGGEYHVSPPRFEAQSPARRPRFAERVYVQANRDMAALAEPSFADHPTLVYVEMTRRPDVFTEAARALGLSVLRREVVA